MEMRVEQLSAQADVSVDTIRYYQSKGLLDPPRREGRIAWYSDGHLDRLTRIRSLQQRGFSLATIARLVSGELDAADEALLGQLTGVAAGAGGSLPPVAGDSSADMCLDLDELASVTGMPLALVKALEAEGLLIPTRVAGQARYTEQDVAASRAGLRLLEWGIPLTDLLDLARRHNRATEATAREAVEMFARHIREPLRSGARPDALQTVGAAGHDALSDPTGDPAVDGLLQAYADLLPAVNTLVGHHFTRTLVKVALDYVEREGSDEEREAVRDRNRTDGGDPAPHLGETPVRSSP